MAEEYRRGARASTTDTPESQESLVRRVCIPVSIMREIDAADLHGIVKDLILWIVYRCLTTRARCCAIHQGLIDASLNSDRRKQLMRFIKASAHIRPASRGLYRPGRQARRYELHGLQIIAESEYQHNNEIVCDGDLGLVCGDVEWRSVDFGPLMRKIEAGWLKLGWDRSRIYAEWSLAMVDDSPMTKSDVVSEARESSKAEQHATQHQRYVDRTTDGVFRKDGRVYTSVTSLPKWIRERVVTFGGDSETVDISCCYLWILAAEHRLSLVRRGRDTTEVDTLLDMIERGDFYRGIAESAGVSASDAKREFNTFCLFGPIGWHPLWHALREICPGICCDIEWWRSQSGGATRLAHFLQRGEGVLMTDGMIDWLVSGGVPAVQIHDGAILPAGVAHVAADWLSEHSQRVFGRACRVKVTENVKT